MTTQENLEINRSDNRSNVTEALIENRLELRKKLDEIEKKIIQINTEYSAQINTLKEQKKPIEEALFHIEALLKLDGHAEILAETSVHETTDNLSISDAAFALMQEKHKPLHYKEITAMLQGKNIHIPGKNPAATLLTRISRDKRFKRDKKRGVYILVGWRFRKRIQSKRIKKHSTRRRQ